MCCVAPAGAVQRRAHRERGRGERSWPRRGARVRAARAEQQRREHAVRRSHRAGWRCRGAAAPGRCLTCSSSSGRGCLSLHGAPVVRPKHAEPGGNIALFCHSDVLRAAAWVKVCFCVGSLECCCPRPYTVLTPAHSRYAMHLLCLHLLAPWHQPTQFTPRFHACQVDVTSQCGTSLAKSARTALSCTKKATLLTLQHIRPNAHPSPTIYTSPAQKQRSLPPSTQKPASLHARQMVHKRGNGANGDVRREVERRVLLAATAVDETRLQAGRLGAVRVKRVHRGQHDLAVPQEGCVGAGQLMQWAGSRAECALTAASATNSPGMNWSHTRR